MNSKHPVFFSVLFYVGLLLIAVGGGIAVIADQLQQRELTPRTELIEMEFGNGATAMMLTAKRVMGSTINGLPNPGDTFSMPAATIEGGDIFVVQTGDEVRRFLKGPDRQFWAFPSEGIDQVLWGSNRVYFVRDGLLVAAGTHDPEQPLEPQIQALMSQTGGTFAPRFYLDGTLTASAYCLEMGDMECRYHVMAVTIDHLAGFERQGDLLYMKVDHFFINNTTEIPQIYLLVSEAEADLIQGCIARMGPNTPNELCAPLE